MLCCHMCRAHARPCLSTGWALNRRFALTFETAAVLAQGGGGISLGDVENCANSVGFRVSLPLLPHLCPLSVLVGVCGVYSESP